MKRIVRSVVSILVLLVTSVASLGVQTAVIKSVDMAHTMSPTHQMNSVNCLSICTTAILHKNTIVKEQDQNEDDEAGLPFFVQFQTPSHLALAQRHDDETRFITGREPPPGDLPPYISLSVFRA